MSLRIDTTEWIGGALLIGETGGGVLGSAIPSTGDNGPGYTYNDLSLPADNGKEICGRITSQPSAGTLFAYEDTSFTFTGAPDGTYTFAYQLYADYVAIGSPVNVTLTVGSGVSASASWTEGADVIAITATAAGGTISAALGWTEQADAVSVQVSVNGAVLAAAAWTEQPDLVAIIESVVNSVTATAAWTEAADVISIAAYTPNTYVRAPSGGGYRTKRTNTTTRPRNTEDSTR